MGGGRGVQVRAGSLRKFETKRSPELANLGNSSDKPENTIQQVKHIINSEAIASPYSLFSPKIMIRKE